VNTWIGRACVTAPTRFSFIDLSSELRRAIKDSGLTEGFVVAFCEHTTCALLINEWESGLMKDLRARIEALVPTDGYYAHDDLSIRQENLTDDERVNGPAHVAQMIIGGTSHVVPFADGEARLGAWQRLYLVELDEPKPRNVSFNVYG
jgi:secondary thiamine-phosphate synthase enzyme